LSVSVLPCSTNFGIHQQKQLKLTVLCFAGQRNFLEFVNTKAPQIDCTLLRGTPKILDFTSQIDSNLFCRTANPFLNLPSKATEFCCILFSRAWEFTTKIDKFRNLPTQKQLKLTLFCSATQREIVEFANTKATQIKCICSTAAKILGIYEQKQLKLTVFCVARAAKNSGICQHQSNSN
jgi:hypothetical protein